MTSQNGYQTVPFPIQRQIVVDAGRLGRNRSLIHGLAEFDVTDVRRRLREYKARTGETLSFTAFIAACLAKAVDECKYAQAYRTWRNELVLFDDVDVVVMIETERDGVALPYIIRAANHKSVNDIHREIRAVQTKPQSNVQHSGLTRIGPYVPALVRRVFYWIVRQNPHWMKQFGGTVIITSVGMFFDGGGWGWGFLPMHTLGITVGGIAAKPAFIDEQLERREFLDVTISFDHDVVDGAPAARFARRFKQLIESGWGLEAELNGTTSHYGK